MDVVFGWLFVSIFLSKVIQTESSLEMLQGTFRVLRKHPQLRQCAEKALRKHVYVGARISDQTDVCEGLPNSWGRNQTIESGYGYVENIHVRINYAPPVERHEAILTIPGVLKKGAKIDIHLTWIKIIQNTAALTITLHETSSDVSARSARARSVRIGIYPSYNSIEEYDKHGDRIENPDSQFDKPQQFLTSNQWKISFEAQRNTLYLLVDDEVMKMKNLTSVRLNYLKYVTLTTNRAVGGDTPIPRIRTFEFTEA